MSQGFVFFIPQQERGYPHHGQRQDHLQSSVSKRDRTVGSVSFLYPFVKMSSFSNFPLAILFTLLYTNLTKDDLPLVRRVHRFGGAPGGKPTVSSCQVPFSRWFSPAAETVTLRCTFTTSPWLPTRVRSKAPQPSRKKNGNEVESYAGTSLFPPIFLICTAHFTQ